MQQNKNLNAFLRPVKESETLLINQISLLRANNKQEVYKFGFGQSPFPIPQYIVNSLVTAANRKEYMSVQGHVPLRKAIAKFHNKLENKNWHADNIIIGSGSKILIFSILAAFAKAEVLLPAPSWVSYEPQAKLLGHPVNWIQTSFDEKWSLTASALDTYCNKRENTETPLILVLNYPSNPTGQTFDETEIRALAEVMEKHKIIVIADEIYSLLKYTKLQNSIVDYYPQGCIVTGGLSKWCGAGGWRLGFTHIPPELGKHLIQGVIGVASETYSCASSPIQIAATTAYEDCNLANDFLSKQVTLLSLTNDYCSAKLNETGVKVHPCEGGFYVFPDFSRFTQKLHENNIFTSQELTTRLMDETGVALLPGSAFGMPKESFTARLAFVDFDGSQILHTPTKQANIEKVKKGITKLCDWVNNL
jgi:aspartate aminotransferase